MYVCTVWVCCGDRNRIKTGVYEYLRLEDKGYMNSCTI